MMSAYTRSDKVAKIPEALSIYMNQLVYSEKRKGKDIMTLSLGEAYFDIPRYSFDELNFEKGYHYSESMGLPELREKIMAYYNGNYDAEIGDISNILISCGSKPIIYMVMQAILNPGDEVLIYEPAWLSYQEQVRLADGTPCFIPYDCTPLDIPKHITEHTKLLVLNNPNNPAGSLLTREELKALYSVCRSKGIFILMDEAYSDFVRDPGDFCSLASIAKDLEGVFIVNSLSKNMGLSGWRVGYVIAAKEQIADVLKLNQHLITCAPTLLQMYLARYFDDIIEVTKPQIAAVVENRRKVTEYMDKIGLSYLPSASTFYIFVRTEGLKADTLDFCLYLLFRYGIACVPGGAYGESTRGFIRIGVGVEPLERIFYALETIQRVIRENETDSVYVDAQLKENGFYRFGT